MQMSKTDESPSFEDFPETEASDDGDAANWIDLEPGDEVVGLITDFNPDAGRNGLVEIDGRPTWLTAGMKDRIIAALVEERRSRSGSPRTTSRSRTTTARR
ncbi:hypothetical protein ACFQL4_13135 [Halosimplex aquaticum]